MLFYLLYFSPLVLGPLIGVTLVTYHKSMQVVSKGGKLWRAVLASFGAFYLLQIMKNMLIQNLVLSGSLPVPADPPTPEQLSSSFSIGVVCMFVFTLALFGFLNRKTPASQNGEEQQREIDAQSK